MPASQWAIEREIIFGHGHHRLHQHTKAIWMRIVIMGKSAYGSSGPAQRGLSFSCFLGSGQLSETLTKSGILLRREFVLLPTTTTVVTREEDDVFFN